MQTLEEKIKELSKIISFKIRVGSGYGKSYTKEWKKVYYKYICLPYIDSRDCQDRLDQVFGLDRSRVYKDIWGKAYCEVSIWDGTKRIPRSDVGEKTKVASEKWEASDSFKRACVNRWLWRFLYTMPLMIITAEELQQNQYNLTSFMKAKYKKELGEWSEKSWYDIYVKSKYIDPDDENELPPEQEIPLDEALQGFWKVEK